MAQWTNRFSRTACSPMIKLWNKHSRVGLHSERDNWLQTSALADPTELRYTENKFILNGFPSHCDGFFFFFFNRVTNSYFDKRIPLENDKSIIYSDYEVVVVCNSVSGRSVRTVIETNKFSFFIFGIIYIYVFYIIYSNISIQGVTFIWEMITRKTNNSCAISIKCMKFLS